MTVLEGVSAGTLMYLFSCNGFSSDSHVVSKARASPFMQQLTSSVESEWEMVAECLAGFDLDDGEEAFVSFLGRLQYVKDHSCGSVDKPCEKRESFPTQDISSGEEDDAGSSDSDSASVEEALAVAEGLHVEERFADISVNADVSSAFRQVRTKMLHFASKDDMHKTCCGQVVGDAFTVYKKDPENAWPKYRVCFGK